MAERSENSENAQVSDLEADVGTDAHNDGKTGRVDKALTRMRSTSAGRLGVRIGVTILGTLIVAVGLVLVPLPGPGWLIVFAGLAIWSIEFHWARRLNNFVRGLVGSWTRWYARQGWPTRIVVGFLTAIFVLLVLAGTAYMSFGSRAFSWIPGTG